MEIFLWVLTLIAGAVAGVIATRTSDRWFRPLGDYELWVDYTATPLFVELPYVAATGLTYSIDSTTLEQPYQVRLWVWRAGSKDVRADAFTGDLVVKLGVPLVPSSMRSDEHTSGAEVGLYVEDGQATFRMRPSLVRPDFVARYDFVSDGRPQFQTHNPVADLKVSSFYAETKDENKARSILAGVGALLLVGGFLGMIALFVLGIIFGPQVVLYLPVTLLATFVGIGCLASSAEAVPRRARLARKILRSRVAGRVLSGSQVEHHADIFVLRER